MANIVTLPQAPNNALTNLGQVIYATSAERAAQKRADELEERRHAERLADIQGERDWTQQRIQGERDWQVKQREENLWHELVRAAAAKGYILPEDRNDPQKVAEGVRRFQEEEQLAILQRLQDEERGRQRANQLAAEGAKIDEEINNTLREYQELQMELHTEIPEVAIRSLAYRLAAPTAKTKGKPDDNEIEERMSDAAEKLEAAKQNRLSRDIQLKSQELNALRYQKASTVSAQAPYAQQRLYGLAPTPSAAPQSSAADTGRQPVSPQDAQKAAAAALKAANAARHGSSRLTSPVIQQKHEAYTKQRLQDIDQRTPSFPSFGTIAGRTLPTIVNEAAKYGEAAGRAVAGQGIAIPKQSILERLGERAGQQFVNIADSGVDRQWEDWVLQNNPNSSEAAEIRKRRAAQGIFPSARLDFNNTFGGP